MLTGDILVTVGAIIVLLIGLALTQVMKGDLKDDAQTYILMTAIQIVIILMGSSIILGMTSEW
jgi:hypothetical protein